MDMYELWDRDSGNIVGEFPDEASAFDVVRGILAVNGREMADTMALVRVDAAGMPTAIAAGVDLSFRALLAEAASTRRRAANNPDSVIFSTWSIETKVR